MIRLGLAAVMVALLGCGNSSGPAPSRSTDRVEPAAPPAPPAGDRAAPAALVEVGDEEEAFARARRDGKRVALLIGAAWSVPSAEAVKVLHDAADTLAPGWVLWRADVTEGTDADEALQERYRARNVPSLIFLDADGRELGRWEQVLSAADLRRILPP